MSYADPRIDPTLSDDVKRLRSAESVVEDMTAIIAKLSSEKDALEAKIADACGELFDVEPSDLTLDDMVDALIEAYKSELIRAAVMSMEPEEDAGVFLVLNVEGRITGPFHNSDRDARAWVKQFGRSSSGFAIARRVATCTTRIETDWKEG